MLCALTSSIDILIILRLFQGMSGAAGIVIARAIVRDHYAGHDLTKFFALLMLINGAAPILAPVIGGQILRFTSWHGVFAVLFIAGLLMLTAVVFGLPESLPRSRRVKGGLKQTLSHIPRLLRDRTFLGYAWSQGFVYAAMFAYIFGSPFVVQDIYHATPQIFSMIFATNGLGIIVASQLSARLSGRYGEKNILVLGLTLAGLGSIVLCSMIVLGIGLTGILPALFVVVASVGMVGTTGSALAMQTQGNNAGSAAAMIGVSQMLLGAAASPLVGIGGGQDAVPMGVVILLCDLLGVACYVLLVKMGRKANVIED